MPLYEYKCASCGDIFEVIQKFSDEPLHEHPGCGGTVERLISRSALQFKGSGWYVNDYGRNDAGSRDKSKGETSGSTSESKSSDEKSSASKSSESNQNGGSKTAATPAASTSSTSTKADK